jgi:hypothetical protein
VVSTLVNFREPESVFGFAEHIFRATPRML